MGVYFDNLGKSIGPIKICPKGVWLSVEDDSNNLVVSSDKAANNLASIYAKTPTINKDDIKIGSSDLPSKQLATVEWVAWAYGVKPEFDLTEYNGLISSVNSINTKLPTIETTLDSLKSDVNNIQITISSNNIKKLNDLFSEDTIVILRGGNAASRAGVS